ncbi:MAG: sigma 54-interacting transcriptional regulator [Acidobacteriota bacterium]
MGEKVSRTTAFRLRSVTGRSGSDDGDPHPEQILPLEPGANGIGSDSGNAVRLQARGVSRFHAVLHLGEGGCELEDLGSKNGSWVNGERITRRALASGDVLTLGSSRWRLDALPAEDVDLALDLQGDPGPDTTVLDPTRTRGERQGDLPLPLLDALLRRLRQLPEPDLGGALIEIAAHLDVDGAAWVEWPSRGPATVVAAAGELGTIPESEALDEGYEIPGAPELCWSGGGDGGARILRRRSKPWGSALVIFGVDDGGPSTATTTKRDPREIVAACFLLLEGVEPLCEENGADGTQAPPRPGLQLPEGIVAATSGPMAAVYRQVTQIADDPVPVLITGETGVGKEHLARALHDGSSRRGGPFVAINCSAIPAELLEAELFGIGQGVATGVKARQGKVREADGGTLFLDEIGDMPQPLQAKLLRVLEDGLVSPVGEGPVRVEVRVVSASHVDLPSAVEARRFRQDLYYRLAGHVLRVPPLRQRRDDLPPLLGSFLRRIGSETRRRVRGVTVKALELLTHHPWPGNVRELQHVARRLVYLCPPGQAVSSSMVQEALGEAHHPARRPEDDFDLGAEGLQDHLAAIEGAILRRALDHTEGNRSKAAELLRISRNSLTRRLERLGLLRD